MKKILVLICLFHFFINCSASITFRVQCIEEKTEAFKKIPEKNIYFMPGTKPLIFSGGYYATYEEAFKRLNEVLELGVNFAFIRVFNQRNYVSDEVSSYLLTLHLKQRFNNQQLDSVLNLSIGRKPKKENTDISSTNPNKVNPPNTLSQNKTNTNQNAKLDSIKNGLKTENKLDQNNPEVLANNSVNQTNNALNKDTNSIDSSFLNNKNKPTTNINNEISLNKNDSLSLDSIAVKSQLDKNKVTRMLPCRKKLSANNKIYQRKTLNWIL